MYVHVTYTTPYLSYGTREHAMPTRVFQYSSTRSYRYTRVYCCEYYCNTGTCSTSLFHGIDNINIVLQKNTRGIKNKKQFFLYSVTPCMIYKISKRNEHNTILQYFNTAIAEGMLPMVTYRGTALTSCNICNMDHTCSTGTRVHVYTCTYMCVLE